MERINNENTSLATIGLTIDLIKQGEVLEFDPEKKVNRRGSYVSLDQVTKAIGLYAKDLLNAYTVIESMEGEIQELNENFNEVAKEAESSASQVRQVLEGQRAFTDSETKLAEMAAQVASLKDHLKKAEKEAASLEAKMEEYKETADQVPELAQDVQVVLDALQASIREAGLSLDDILDSLPE